MNPKKALIAPNTEDILNGTIEKLTNPFNQTAKRFLKLYPELPDILFKCSNLILVIFPAI